MACRLIAVSHTKKDSLFCRKKMNENSKTSAKLGLIALILIILALIAGVYFVSRPEPVNVAPRAEESGAHRLFFRLMDPAEQEVDKDTTLSPGKEFALVMMLSRGSSLEQDKRYKFHLKFDYNANLLDLTKPYDGKLNEGERANGEIISMSSVFNEVSLDKVEEKAADDDQKKAANIRTVDIEGWFKSNNYTRLDDRSRPEDKKGDMSIVALKKFQVRPAANLDNPNTRLFYWYKNDAKVERVDWYVNPNDELKLELVDLDLSSVQTGKQVVPEPDSKPVTFGEIKETPVQPETGGPAGSTAAMTLKLSLRFQGILQKPGSPYDKMVVKVTAVGPAGRDTQTGEFTARDDGVFTGTVGFNNLASGGKYTLFVKGPQHLQKRLCNSNPTETYPGSYTCGEGKITLNAGVNTFDLSGVYLLAGDLPEQNGSQNGFVNSYDLSLIRNNLNSADPNILKLADINRDGIINTQDFSLVIAALEFRSDETFL